MVGPGTELTPHLQSPAKSLGAVTHPRETPVSGTSALFGDLRINATPVVSHVQKKLGIVVRNFRLDLVRLRMAKGISQCLATNPVDFVAQHGIEVPLFPFDHRAHVRGGTIVALRRQLLTQRGQRPRYVAFPHNGLPQV
jgi:hypothetical protein